MIENREDGWQELEAKARQILDDPRSLKDDSIKGFLPILHLWATPTFTPEKHWVFYKPQPQMNPRPSPIVRQLIWMRQDDYERLNDPLTGMRQGFQTEPAFDIRTSNIEADLFENLLGELSKISFPAFVSDDMLGRDGEYYGIETFGLSNSAKVFWWYECPSGWESLAAWYNKTKSDLEERFRDS